MKTGEKPSTEHKYNALRGTWEYRPGLPRERVSLIGKILDFFKRRGENEERPRGLKALQERGKLNEWYKKYRKAHE